MIEVIHKLEIYCFNDEDYELLLKKIELVIEIINMCWGGNYRLEEENEHGYVRIFHHHFNLIKKK